MNVYKIYCDGGSRGNPGPGASSFVIYKNNIKYFENSIFLGNTTNNIAEYNAILIAYKWLRNNIDNNVINEIYFYLDSELAVKQLSGEYKIKSNKLKPLIYQIKEIEIYIKGNISYKHITRSKNKLADDLVNKKLDSILKISRPRVY